jgi:hypothetical protein
MILIHQGKRRRKEKINKGANGLRIHLAVNGIASTVETSSGPRRKVGHHVFERVNLDWSIRSIHLSLA